MTKKRRSKYAVFAIVFVLVSLITGTFLTRKVINHESNQSDSLSVLEGRISLIEEKMNQAESLNNEDIWPVGGVQLFSNR